jgi:transposase
MNKTLVVEPLSGVHFNEVMQTGAGWEVAATGPGCGTFASCGVASTSRHSTYLRTLQDLPAQGSPVTIRLTVTRLKCRNPLCLHWTFTSIGAAVRGPRERRKGFRFGTIMVDLERCAVVEVLGDRSSSSVAAWLSARPSIEIISRDDGVRQAGVICGVVEAAIDQAAMVVRSVGTASIVGAMSSAMASVCM